MRSAGWRFFFCLMSWMVRLRVQNSVWSVMSPYVPTAAASTPSALTVSLPPARACAVGLPREVSVVTKAPGAWRGLAARLM